MYGLLKKLKLFGTIKKIFSFKRARDKSAIQGIKQAWPNGYHRMELIS